jgi:hypothetical protein
MNLEQIDQRDIQKKGGPYVKFPTSYIICSMLFRYDLKNVLDITYGEGRFYRTCRDNIVLIGSDPERWDWVVKPDLFYQFNVFYLYNLLSKEKIKFPLRKVDVVVVDPPRWTAKAKYNKREMFNNLVGTPDLIIQFAGKIAKELNIRYILVHYRAMVQIEGFTPIHVVEFKWFARYLNSKNKNKSYYVLYKVQ